MLRVRQLALVARDLDPVVDDLKSVFGVEVAFNDPGVASFGLKNAVIPVGHQFVEVVAPIEENTAGGRYLDRRNGDGGYMVILQCDDHPPYKQRVDELGIRKVAEAEEKNYSIMQLHPADTSGSFLEIDVQGAAQVREQVPDAILILLTGDRAEAVRPEAERAGVDEVIEKPFTVATMERAFERALARVAGPGHRG